MAGAQDHELAIAVAGAGGLGSIPCAMLDAEAIQRQVGLFRAAATASPLNLNFFCHPPLAPDAEREARWRALLRPYYLEAELDGGLIGPAPVRASFDDRLCSVVESLRPEVVSFHFGLPSADLLARVRATGAVIMCSATSVAEARHLESQGCDLVIAQGAEAGGHRGTFLDADISAQAGTLALVPQVVDAVHVPVIAAGGITDARGIAAALALGACGVQMGTTYLRCPEAKITTMHRRALASATDTSTRITALYTGRPARGLETRLMRELRPREGELPPFPWAAGALAPLRALFERKGSVDFSPLWAGQAAALARELPAGELTRELGTATRALLRRLSLSQSSI
jgi:nitronate monooxygenase